ncbi:hypothetical protein G8759_31235 [Spirosoma aureum]|uniref:Uncharacterized protein n=1 Tax=Spirosoma aureum TaxID=2692134 RepID=A0A6G9AWS2_9BACT|nr:hypothetical protein [Spirosoma aureum]QIP16798.1 hypothetical protein G8759_31235 [Spirosoma aureum]
MQATTVQDPLADKRADLVFKIMAAVGFMLDALDALDHATPGGKQQVFRAGLKNAAQKFKLQLETAEAHIAGHNYHDREQAMDQMAESYQVMDNLLTIMLQASLKLTPAAMELMNNEMIGVATKWGIKLEE